MRETRSHKFEEGVMRHTETYYMQNTHNIYEQIIKFKIVPSFENLACVCKL